MSKDLYLSLEGFQAACESAIFYYPRPYGIYHKGEFFWDKKLPRRPGSAVRYFEDTSGPCLSLVVLTVEGEFLCSAYPLIWAENDHPAQHEAKAIWEAMTPEERKQAMGD